MLYSTRIGNFSAKSSQMHHMPYMHPCTHAHAPMYPPCTPGTPCRSSVPAPPTTQRRCRSASEKAAWGSLSEKPGVRVPGYRRGPYGPLDSVYRSALKGLNVYGDLSSLEANITEIGHGNVRTPCFRDCDLKDDRDQCMSTFFRYLACDIFQ